MKKAILFISVIIISLIFYSLFSTETINSLKGGFKELAFVRNENNTGPIIRIYAFSVEDTLWTEMQKHADLLPHTKYGTTEVYYFLNDDSLDAELKLNMSGLSQEAKPKCLFRAIKDGQSRLEYIKNPF
jgi:hypothetical protein